MERISRSAVQNQKTSGGAFLLTLVIHPPEHITKVLQIIHDAITILIWLRLTETIAISLMLDVALTEEAVQEFQGPVWGVHVYHWFTTLMASSASRACA